MQEIYLLLGTNLGDRQAQLQTARHQLSEQLGEVLESSSIYETAAWGVEDQPSFYNQVLKLKTSLMPFEILAQTQAIEEAMGRIRLQKWGTRCIDIDILYVENVVLDTEKLRIPHPFLHQRRFTLVPLVEIAPDFLHPVLGFSNQKLLEDCPDSLEVHLLKL